MKLKPFYFALIAGILTISLGCGSSKKSMTLEEWDNGTAIEKTLYSMEEVDNIVSEMLNAEHRDRPYQAPEDKLWELQHTQLRLELDFKQKTINGNAEITLKPYFYPQRELVLDAKGMDIFSVEINQTSRFSGNPQPATPHGTPHPDPVKWSYTDSLHLKITLPYAFNPSETLTLSIAYQANPERPLSNAVDLSQTAVSDDKGVYFVNADGTQIGTPQQVWTQGEPESNSRWFPTLDKPNQKHTHEFTLVYPDTLISVSNGHLTASKKLEGTGLKEDRWMMNQRHAVYLSMFAIGSWKAVRDSVVVFYPETNQRKTIPVTYFVEESYVPFAKQKFGNTPEMIQFFSKITGVPYPWNKYDQIVCREFVSGAMENTTAVIHNERLQDPNYDTEDYVSHELFHHWFGDYATCESWSHLSMNESFACYSEYLWREFKYGKDNAQEWLYDNTSYPSMSDDTDVETALKPTPLINPHFHHPNDQFDDVRYNKGARILHELRQYIGDSAFFLSMKSYLTQFAYKNGNANDWKKSIETVTGRNMDHFFNSWYFQGGEFMMAYSVEPNTTGLDFDLILTPGITENKKAMTSLKAYGNTKFQYVYVHVLGTNNQKWDTTLVFLPHSKKTTIRLPFQDSFVFVRYTNPQNETYTFDKRDFTTRREARFDEASYCINRAHYIIHEPKFSYMEKVEWVRELSTQYIGIYQERSLTSQIQHHHRVLEMLQTVLSLEKSQESLHQRPLLAKVLHEFCGYILRETAANIPKEQSAQHLQTYHDLLHQQWLSAKSTAHQIFYLNFYLSIASQRPDFKARLEHPEFQAKLQQLKSSNDVNALEALYFTYIHQGYNLVPLLTNILTDSQNCAPVQCRFFTKIWSQELEEWNTLDLKKSIIPQIAAKQWSDDLKVAWLNGVFSDNGKNATLLLDAWYPLLKLHPHWILSTQFVLHEEWQNLQKNRLNLDKQGQFRYSVLEQIFSIKP